MAGTELRRSILRLASAGEDGVIDFGDQISDPENGYGSMQIHNYDARQTLFAINNWKSGPGADLGIGNRPGDVNTDWTFSGTSKNYTSKKLKVFVRLKL